MANDPDTALSGKKKKKNISLNYLEVYFSVLCIKSQVSKPN